MTQNRDIGILPSFIIGGATAAGSSFLSSLLSQHHQVYLPKDDGTEPHFFSLDHRYARGLGWYKKWFEKHRDEKAIGDRSSSYLHFPDAAIRIRQLIPRVKFIFLLRNPVDRAWAHYRYMVLRGIEILSFEEALAQEEMRRQRENKESVKLRHFDYVYRSKYGIQLTNYIKFFSFNQILIIDSNKLRIHVLEQLKKITDFLEIEPFVKFDIPSDFPSLSVKQPKVQFDARKHFGVTKSRLIIEAIRHKEENLKRFVENKKDYFYISQIKNNLYEIKEELPERLRYDLEGVFKDDQNKFFELTKGHIDFGPWYQ